MTKFAVSAALSALLVSGAAEAASYVYGVQTDSQANQAVTVFESAGSIADFYNYYDASGHPSFPTVSDEVLLFLHRDTTTGILGLGMIIDTLKDGSGGSLSFTVSGAPAGSLVTRKDDGGETPAKNAVNGSYDFNWNACCTDGFAAEGFEDAAWSVLFTDFIGTGLNGGSFINADGSLIALGAPGSVTLTAAAVPVPAALPLAASGLALLGYAARRARKA